MYDGWDILKHADFAIFSPTDPLEMFKRYSKNRSTVLPLTGWVVRIVRQIQCFVPPAKRQRTHKGFVAVRNNRRQTGSCALGLLGLPFLEPAQQVSVSCQRVVSKAFPRLTTSSSCLDWSLGKEANHVSQFPPCTEVD